MTAASRDKRQRILIVANRLPVSIKRTGRKFDFVPSAGGLATGLRSLQGTVDMQWIGWPGSVPKTEEEKIRKRLKKEFDCTPVFMSERLVQKYYEGYSNGTVWPVFHLFSSSARFDASEWEAYTKANELFAETVAEVYRPGDTIWIHDYHLMVLPRLLRERFPDASIGFFLHIPFPPYEIFRTLPQHKEIIDGLSALDLVGFHTHDYLQSFLGCIRALMGHTNTLGEVAFGSRIMQADVFPMGIDMEKFEAAGTRSAPLGMRSKQRTGRKIVFSVSRLDYTKGIPESLRAFEEFLDTRPEWHEKLEYFLVVVPSREKVQEYAALKKGIDETVGRINSRFGSLDWTPVRYIYRSLSFENLTGLYANADIALVLPLRDGMNLVAKEYLATKTDDLGVLILSEMAGASKELVEAIIVNPNSPEDVAEALHEALLMPEADRRRRNQGMRQRLRRYDIHSWTRSFLDRLSVVRAASVQRAVRPLDSRTRKELLEDYRSGKSRLIVLDYDGTLVPFAETPEGARPDEDLRAVLKGLAANPANTVVILSGRDRHSLETWLGDLPITLVSEHGGWVRDPGMLDWKRSIATNTESWKEHIRPLLELTVDRIPASFIEEKEFALVWHYRKANRQSASAAARELLNTITSYTINLGVQVLPGNRTIEVRNAGISKGIYCTNHLLKKKFDFIFAAGDDWTDEDMFGVLPQNAYSFKVGMRTSKANFNLSSTDDVRGLLRFLAGN